MKILVSLATVLIAIPSVAAENPLAKVNRINCHRIDDKNDVWTITPNMYVNGEKNFVAVSGYKIRTVTLENGTVHTYREEKPDFFYETVTHKDAKGRTLMAFVNLKYQFVVDREVSLVTEDFKTGRFSKIAMQPGVGGYGPGGIPQATIKEMKYNCEFN